MRYVSLFSVLYPASGYAHRITQAISSHILQCQCMKELLVHLERRGVVASTTHSHILGLLPDVAKAAASLQRVLVGRSRESGDEASKIESVYLAFLDCYEHSGNEWCRNVAINVLRPAGMYMLYGWCCQHVHLLACVCFFTVRAELKLPDRFYGMAKNLYKNHNNCAFFTTLCHATDLAIVMQRVPDVQIPQNEAERLSEKLGLAEYGTRTDLRGIVRLSLMARVTFPALVSALLLTPHTGQYLSLLLPYGIDVIQGNMTLLH